jgi:mitochondrial import receptor subunit TOM40
MFPKLFGYKPVRAESTPSEVATKEVATTPAHPILKAAPLQYEQFAKEWQSLTAQDNFDGFRIEAGKAVTKNLQASHSLILGTGMRESGYFYQFGPTYQSVDGKSFATARVGLDGGVSGRLGTQVTDSLDVKLSGSSSLKEPQRNALEMEICYAGSASATVLKVVHQGTWILNGSFSQEISDNLWLGSELTYIPMNGVSITSFGGRYVAGPHIFTGTVGQQPDFKSRNPLDSSNSCKLQYMKKVSERLALGVEMESSLPDRESALKLGYDYTFRQARVQGMLDTAGKISCFVSDFMGFGVSGMIDYVSGDYKFGFMMHIVPQPEGAPQ